MPFEVESDDESTLINLRYALADALELCEKMSPDNRSESIVISQMIKSANIQVMLLLKLQEAEIAPTKAQVRLAFSAA